MYTSSSSLFTVVVSPEHEYRFVWFLSEALDSRHESPEDTGTTEDLVPFTSLEGGLTNLARTG